VNLRERRPAVTLLVASHERLIVGTSCRLRDQVLKVSLLDSRCYVQVLHIVLQGFHNSFPLLGRKVFAIDVVSIRGSKPALSFFLMGTLNPSPRFCVGLPNSHSPFTPFEAV